MHERGFVVIGVKVVRANKLGFARGIGLKMREGFLLLVSRLFMPISMGLTWK